MILVSEGRGTTQKSTTQHMTNTSQDTTYDSSEATSVGGKYEIWTKTVPMIVRMECSRSTTSPRRNVTLPPLQGRCPHRLPLDVEEVPVLSLQACEYVSHLEAADTT
jgi:hypothetical protein